MEGAIESAPTTTKVEDAVKSAVTTTNNSISDFLQFVNNDQKTNRVIVAQFASKEAIANTPHSPRFENIISRHTELNY